MTFAALKRHGFRMPLDRIPDGAVFWAPLKHNVRDYTGNEGAGTFTRASDGIYLRGGTYQIAANDVPRFEAGGMLFEPAVTNKCTNYNANPDAGLTNISTGGTGTLTRESDAAALAAAGLAEICTDGNVVQVVSGGTTFNANVAGDTGNTNPHTVSIWIKKVGATGEVYVRLTDGSVGLTITNTEYMRVLATTALPGAATKLQVRCANGATARFVLNQLEELPVVSSPIITTGASASRAADNLEWAAAPSGLADAAGAVFADVSLPLDPAQYATNARTGIFGVDNFSVYSMLNLNMNRAGAGNCGALFSHSGTPMGPVFDPAANEVFRVAAYWTAGGNANCGVYLPSAGAWSWSTAQAFTSIPFQLKTRIGYLAPGCVRIHRVMLFNRAFSQADIARLFTP